jgi:5-methylcytosine-specific restriction endonuclease McrA
MTVADKRYNTQRWRRVRRLVLQRDMYRCWIPGCPRLANQCDHIIPVEPGFPDSLFFGMHNLRASCRPHNTARGVAAKLERETSEGVRGPLGLTVFDGGARPAIGWRRDPATDRGKRR